MRSWGHAVTVRRALFLGAALGYASLSSPRVAWADTSDEDKALATTLFIEARALLAAGTVGEACRKLEESRRLDPQPGTILNLAVCHEREGLMASAFAEFREARVMAERDHREDRVALASQHLSAMELQVPKLVLVVGPAVDVPDLRVVRDGTPLGRAAWGTRIPVDPGDHVLEVSAPGKKTRTLIVKIERRGDVQTVVLEPLEDDAAVAPPPVVVSPGVPPASSPSMPVDRTSIAPPRASPSGASHGGLGARRTVALASAGAALVGVGVGTYFGVRAIQKHDDPSGICSTSPCSGTSVSINDDAKRSADAATVSFSVALVALGAAAFLWLGDAHAADKAPVAVVVPSVGPGIGGLRVSGRF